LSIKVLAILQARSSSSRLPRKVLKPILGVPMILRQIERELAVDLIDKLVVATSTDSSDDILVRTLEENNISVYRGSLDNVLDRFYQCSILFKPEHIVRLTADCPLADPGVIDHVIQEHLEMDVDYTTNCSPPTWPDGLDVEIMKFTALASAWREAELPSELEHVTPFIRNHPKRFLQHNVANKRDISNLRWTVDEPEDLKFVREIYQRLYPTKCLFDYHDILNCLENNHSLSDINSKFNRNEGSLSSYKKDLVYLSRLKKNE
jgi:spore coat polysaccharide biosynthesis protein SpsF